MRMRLLTFKTLKLFWENHTDATSALKVWVKKVEEAQWSCFSDIKKEFNSADVLPGNRVVFNIKGNRYRIVVKIHYNTKFMYVRFIGTHAEYDRIDAETI
jgi:mRNA interferase HigB